MAMNVGTLNIELIANLARLQKDMNKAVNTVDTSMKKIARTTEVAKNAFGGLAVAFSARNLLRIVDDYKKFDAQLKLSSDTLQEYKRSYQDVIRIGKTSMSDIGALGVFYARLRNNMRDYNVEQSQIARVAETVSLALRVNNATVQETNSVMLQLSQSFGSGRLNGQEFLALSEGAPNLMRRLADALRVPYGALKDMSAAGELTREKLLQAFSDPEYLESLRQQVKEINTVSASMTVFMNNFKVYLGELDKSTGITNTFGKSIQLLGENLDYVARGVGLVFISYILKSIKAKYADIVATKAQTDAERVKSVKDQEYAAIRAKIDADDAKRLADKRILKEAASKQIEFANQRELVQTRELALAKAQESVRTLEVIKVSRDELIARNQVALSKQNDAIRTLEQSKNMAGLSGALREARLAEIQLIEAQKARSIIMNELAVLGRQQANVNKEIAASMAQATAAQTALTKASTTHNLTLANNASAMTRYVHDYNEAVAINNKLSGVVEVTTGKVTVMTKAVDAAKLAWAGLNKVVSLFGGWINAALTVVILFSDKIYGLYERIRGLTPEMKALNDQIERKNKLEGKGISATDPNSDKLLEIENLRKNIAEDKAIVAKAIENQKRLGNATKFGMIWSDDLSASYKSNNDLITEGTKRIQEHEAAIKSLKKEINSGYGTRATPDFAGVESMLSAERQKAQDEAKKAQDDAKKADDAQKRFSDYYNRLKDEFEGLAKANEELQDKAQERRIERADKFAEYQTKLQNELDETSKKFLEMQEDRQYKSIQATAKKYDQEWKQVTDNVGRSIVDSIVRGFEQGKSVIQSFKDAIKNSFKSFVVTIGINFAQNALSGMLKSVLGGIGGNFGKTLLGLGSAATAGSANASSTFDIFNSGSRLLDGITKGFDTANIAFEQSIQNLGTFLVDKGFDNIGGMISQYSSQISSVLPYTGAALQLLSGDIKGAAFSGAGTAIGSYFGGPIGGAIGGALGSVVGGMFGSKKRTPRYSAGVTTNYNNGVFSSQDVYGIAGFNKDAGGREGLTSASKVFSESLNGLLKSFGITSNIQTQLDFFKRKGAWGWGRATVDGKQTATTGRIYNSDTETAFNELVDAFLTKGLTNAIRVSKLPASIKSLFKDITDKTVMSNMINATQQLASAQDALNDTYGMTLHQSGKVALATGLVGDELASFVSKLATFALESRTPAQQLIAMRDNLNTLAGRTLPSTVAEFDAIIKGLNKTSTAGSKTAATLFSLREQFASYVATMDNTKSAVDSAVFGLLSPQQQQVELQAKLSESFAKLNLSVPSSVSQLIAIGKGIDYTTEAGLNLALAFPTLVEQFSAVNEQAANLATTLGLVNINDFTNYVDYTRARSYVSQGLALPANMPSYDVGTNFVPNDGVAMIHQGERIIPANENSEITRALNGNSVSNAELLSEVRRLNSEVARLGSELARVSTNTKNTETILRRVSRDGNEIVVVNG